MKMLGKTLLLTLFFLSSSLISSPVHTTGHSYGGANKNVLLITGTGDNGEKPMNNEIIANCDPKMIIPGNPDIDPKMLIPGDPDIDPKILITENDGIKSKIKITDKENSE